MTACTSASGDETARREPGIEPDPRSPLLEDGLCFLAITPGRTHPDDSGEEEHEEFRQRPQGSIASHRYVS